MSIGDRFAIGYSTYGMHHKEFTQSLLALAFRDAYGPQRWHCGQVHYAEGPYLAQNRSDLARVFIKTSLETNVPWLVMIDTDTLFEPQAIYDLVDSASPIDRPIVTAAQYGFIGDGPLTVIWLRWDENRIRLRPIYKVAGGLEEIDACGMGFCAIHRNVLLALMKTRPHDQWATFGHDQQWNPDTEVITYSGEDVTFCLRAKALGFSVWGHSDIEVDHMKIGRQNRNTRRVALAYNAKGKSTII